MPFFIQQILQILLTVFSVRRIKKSTGSITLYSKKDTDRSLTLIEPDYMTRLKALPGLNKKQKRNFDPWEWENISLHPGCTGSFESNVSRSITGNYTWSTNQPDQLPLKISKINIHIDNIIVDTTKPGCQRKLFFSDKLCYIVTTRIFCFRMAGTGLASASSGSISGRK